MTNIASFLVRLWWRLCGVPHWVAIRFPHIETQSSLHRHPYFSCFRIYGLRPYCRLCLFDVTRTSHRHDSPAVKTIVRLGGFVVWESA
jgi:hypothetical protein